MLQTLAIILVLLWLLGMLGGLALGGLIHLLLAVALVFVLIRVIQGRKPV